MASPLDQEYWQRALQEATPKCRSIDDVGHMSELSRRKTSPEASSIRELPIQLIIGIAIAGFAVVFCMLAIIACCCARCRHRDPKGSRRAPELERGNMNATMALRSHPPHAMAMGTKPHYSMFTSRSQTSRLTKKPPTDSWDAYHSNSSSQSKFRLTGLRDSWPLGGWATSPPRHQNKSKALSFNTDTSLSGYRSEASSQMSENMQPARAGMTKYGGIIVNDIGPAMRATHSAKGSISSMKRPSMSRRSVSDEHLTSILRSTSQRLRDSQRADRPRATSIMSSASGPPPGIRPPSLPSDSRTGSNEGPIDRDEGLNYADSVKSSVLSIYSRHGSPAKMNTAHNDHDRAHERPVSPLSDDDSVCEMSAVEIVIPVGLTSPSKRRKTAERHKVKISSEYNSPARMHKNSRDSMVAVEGTNVTSAEPSSTSNDPFFSSLSVRKSRSTGARFQLQRKATFGSRPIKPTDEKSPLPFRTASEDANDTIKESVVSVDTQPNPFQWSPQATMTSLQPHKPSGPKKKGHKRSQTVRVSGLPRARGNVSTVHEEPESEPNSPATPIPAHPTPLVQISSPGSPDPILNANKDTSPPLVQTFQPLLSIPSIKSSVDNSNRSSQASQVSLASQASLASYPLSVYDYYSDIEIFNLRFSQGQSTANNMERHHRHGGSYSIDGTSHPNLSHSFSRKSLSVSAIPHLPHPSQFSMSRSPSQTTISTIEIESGNEELPPSPPHSPVLRPLRLFPSPTKLYGPRKQPGSDSPPRTSLANSVNLLRRMNSQLSHYAPVSARSSAAMAGIGKSPRFFATPPLPSQISQQTANSSPESSPGSSSPESKSPNRRGSPRSGRKGVKIAETIKESDSPPADTDTRSASPSPRPYLKPLQSLQTDLSPSPEPTSPSRQSPTRSVSSRSSTSSLGSTFNLGFGLGLRLTGDGSPRPTRRKDSMWGAESTRSGRSPGHIARKPSNPYMSTIPTMPPMPEMPPLDATYIVPRTPGTPGTPRSPARSPKWQTRTDGGGSWRNATGNGAPSRGRTGRIDTGSPNGRDGRDLEVESPQAQSQAPMWGQKWRSSLGLYEIDSPGLYDKNGFLLSSPPAGSLAVKPPGSR